MSAITCRWGKSCEPLKRRSCPDDGGTGMPPAAFKYRRPSRPYPERISQMNRNVLYIVIAILAVVAGVFAYQAYERDRNSLQIEVGPNGIKVDPPK